ncbi:MAG TPA: hypothetical protein VFG05_03945 [Methylocella sp.]|nr:hypothetical protein [Methylocella sp.]
MKTTRIVPLALCIAFSGLAAPSASAMPLNGLGAAFAKPLPADNIEKARWVCGPYGYCRWAPGWRRCWWGGPWWGYRYGCYYPWRRHWGWGPWGYRYYW